MKETWENVAITKSANFRICWCMGSDKGCETDNDFKLTAATFEVHGVFGNPIEEVYTVGNPFKLILRGRKLLPFDRVSVVHMDDVPYCGAAGTAKVHTYTQGTAGTPNVYDNLDSGESGIAEIWSEVILLRVGRYLVCWCGEKAVNGGLGCETDGSFRTKVQSIFATGPARLAQPITVAGAKMEIRLIGAGFDHTDRISIVKDNIDCGSPAVQKVSDAVFVSGVAPQGNSSSAGTLLGPPDYITKDKTIAIWRDIVIKTRGTYHVCWAGNYSVSRRCITRSDINEPNLIGGIKLGGELLKVCSVWESMHYPILSGKLEVGYGFIPIVGKTKITRCEGVDLVALQPATMEASARTQLAEWSCRPKTEEPCNSIHDHILVQGRNTLELAIPPNILGDGLDRARFKAATAATVQPYLNFTVMLSMMVDDQGVTRRGEIDVTVYMSEPLLERKQKDTAIIREGEDVLKLQVNLVFPDRGCNDAESVTNTKSQDFEVQWHLLSEGNTMVLENPDGNPLRLVMPDFAERAGPGKHTVIAKFQFKDYEGAEVAFDVHVVPKPRAGMNLAIPNRTMAGCSFIVEANGEHLPEGSEYRWSCSRLDNSTQADWCEWANNADGRLHAIAAPEYPGTYEIHSFAVSPNGTTIVSASRQLSVLGYSKEQLQPFVRFREIPIKIVANQSVTCMAVLAQGHTWPMTGSPQAMTCPASQTNKTKWELHDVTEDFGLGPYYPTLQLLAKSVPLQPIDDLYMVMTHSIAPISTLFPGRQYHCRLTIIDPQGPGSQDVQFESHPFTVNAAPTSGRTSIIPKIGQAIVTEFSLVTSSWEDEDLPLDFAFAMERPYASNLRGWGREDRFVTILSTGVTTIVGFAKDAFGAHSSARATGEVRDIDIRTTNLNGVFMHARSTRDSKRVSASVSAVADVLSAQGNVKPSVQRGVESELIDLLWMATNLTSTGELTPQDLEVRSQALSKVLAMRAKDDVSPSYVDVAATEVLRRTAQEMVFLASRGQVIAAPAVESLLSSGAGLTSQLNSGDATISNVISSELQTAVEAVGDIMLWNLMSHDGKTDQGTDVQVNGLGLTAALTDRNTLGSAGLRFGDEFILQGAGRRLLDHNASSNISNISNTSNVDNADNASANGSNSSMDVSNQTGEEFEDAISGDDPMDPSDDASTSDEQVESFEPNPFEFCPYPGALSVLLTRWPADPHQYIALEERISLANMEKISAESWVVNESHGIPADVGVASLRLQTCSSRGTLGHASASVELRFPVPAETVGDEYEVARMVSNSTGKYKLKITAVLQWECAQWYTKQQRWIVDPRAAIQRAKSSVTCSVVAGTTDGATFMAIVPVAREKSRVTLKQAEASSILEKLAGAPLGRLIGVALVCLALVVPLSCLLALDREESGTLKQRKDEFFVVDRHHTPLQVEEVVTARIPPWTLFDGLIKIRSLVFFSWIKVEDKLQKLNLPCFRPPEDTTGQVIEVQSLKNVGLFKRASTMAHGSAFTQAKQRQFSDQLETDPDLREAEMQTSEDCLFASKQELEELQATREHVPFLGSWGTLNMTAFADRRCFVASLQAYRTIMNTKEAELEQIVGDETVVNSRVQKWLLSKLGDGRGGQDLAQPFFLRVAHHALDHLRSMKERGFVMDSEELDGWSSSVKRYHDLLYLCAEHDAEIHTLEEEVPPIPQPRFAPPSALRVVLIDVNEGMEFGQAGQVAEGEPVEGKANQPPPSPRRSRTAITSAADADVQEKQPMGVGYTYFLWSNCCGKLLYLHRTEAVMRDFTADLTEADLAMAQHEVSVVYVEEEDIRDFGMSENDDQELVLVLESGVKYRLRGDDEVRAWVNNMQDLRSGRLHNPRSLQKPPANEYARIADRPPGDDDDITDEDTHGKTEVLSRENIKCLIQNWTQSQLTNQNHPSGQSFFSYALGMPPTTCVDVFFLTNFGDVVPGIIWYSHGGTVLSGAQWKTSTKQNSMLETTADDDAMRRKLHRAHWLLAKGVSDGNPLQCLGFYIRDLTAMSEEVRGNIHASNRFMLVLSFKDDTKVRMCFDAQYTRSLCRNSLQSLQGLVNPKEPVKLLRNGVVKHVSGQLALPPIASPTRPPELQLEDQLQLEDDSDLDRTVKFAESPSSDGVLALTAAPDKEKLIKKKAAEMKNSGHAARQKYRSKSFATERAFSEDTATRMRAQGKAWTGLYGTLELTIMSGGMLNIADPNAPKNDDDSIVATKGKKGRGAAVIVAPKVYQPSPFVAVVLHSQPMPRPPEVWKTQVTKRSANPIWNERRTFTIQYDSEDIPPQDVRLEVWDFCDTGAHTFMGEAVVPFPWQPGTEQFHVDLQSNTAKMKDKFHQASGTISFQIKWKEEDTPASISEMVIQEPEFHRTICGTLAIECSRCSGLRKSDLLASDPYCIVHVCAQPGQVKSWRSSTAFGTLNPVWLETFECRVNWPKNEVSSAATITVEIWDHDQISSDDFLGEVCIPIPIANGEDALNLPLESNRSKSQTKAKGRIQLRVAFRDQFTDTDFEKKTVKDPEPYMSAFCKYFATRAINDAMARRVSPHLCYLHYSTKRIIKAQFMSEFSKAIFDLQTRWLSHTRSQRYMVLVTTFCYGILVAAHLVSAITDPKCRYAPTPESIAAQAATKKGPVLCSDTGGPSQVALSAMILVYLLSLPVKALLLWGFRRNFNSGHLEDDQKNRVIRCWAFEERFAWIVVTVTILACIISSLIFLYECSEQVASQWGWTVALSNMLLYVVAPSVRAGIQIFIMCASRSSSLFDWLLVLKPSILDARGRFTQQLVPVKR
jgi:hypothetical protein